MSELRNYNTHVSYKSSVKNKILIAIGVVAVLIGTAAYIYETESASAHKASHPATFQDGAH